MFMKNGNNALISGELRRPAEYSLVGANQKAKTQFSIRVGYGDEAYWQRCVCWGTLAETAKTLATGDYVMAAGVLKTNEYNGKTYTDLNCDFVTKSDLEPRTLVCPDNIPPAFADASATPLEQLDDDELPF